MNHILTEILKVKKYTQHTFFQAYFCRLTKKIVQYATIMYRMFILTNLFLYIHVSSNPSMSFSFVTSLQYLTKSLCILLISHFHQHVYCAVPENSIASSKDYFYQTTLGSSNKQI